MPEMIGIRTYAPGHAPCSGVLFRTKQDACEYQPYPISSHVDEYMPWRNKSAGAETYNPVFGDVQAHRTL